jgi:hypothetical protein
MCPTDFTAPYGNALHVRLIRITRSQLVPKEDRMQYAMKARPQRAPKVQGPVAGFSLVLFRDGRSASSDAFAILHDIVRSRAGHYALTEIDVKDRPGLASQYNVRATPTTLLMKNGDIVDRIVGTPTTSLVNNLLDTRTAHIPDAYACTAPVKAPAECSGRLPGRSSASR